MNEVDYTEMTIEQLHASSLAFLLEGDDEEAADALSKCKIERVFEPPFGSHEGWHLTVTIRTPRAVYDQVNEDNAILNRGPDYSEDFATLVAKGKLAGRIRGAFEAVLPHDANVGQVYFRAHVADVDKRSLNDLIAQTFGREISNQAPLAREAKFWNDLRFRSYSETRIAQALEEAGVMFFPLSRCRVTNGRQRVTREPDFLVCHHGKWGILEVDGEPFHPPSRTTEDHARDRLFQDHGLKVVQHYDAKQCRDYPKAVVEQFLKLLEKNG